MPTAFTARLLLLSGTLLAGLANAQPTTPPIASLASSRLVATENSQMPVLITVQIDRAIDHDLPILLDLVGGSAQPGADFMPPDAPPIIPAGSLSASVALRIRDDELREGDETIAIALLPGNGYQPGMPRLLQIVIRDDDATQEDLRQRLQMLIDNTPDPLIASQLETLGRLCANGMPPPGSELADRCARLRLALLNPAEARRLVDSLRGLVAEELSSQRRGFRMLANGQLGGIGRRLEAIRHGGGRGLNFSGLQLDDQTLPDDSVGGDGELLGGGLGLFFTGTLGRGDRDSTDLESGFETDTRSLLVGLDKRIGTDWVIGAALGHSRFEADLDADAGELDMDLNALTLYTSFSRDAGWLDGSLGYGRGDIDQLRNATFETITDEDTEVTTDVLQATPDVRLLSASLSGGWDFQRGRWSFGPRLAAEYARLTVDRYAETAISGSDSFAVRIEEQRIRSLLVRAGVGVSAAFSTSGAVLLPQFEVYHVTQLEDEAEALRASFVNDPSGVSFELPTSAVDDRNGEYSIGLSALFPHGRSFFISYRRQFGLDAIEQDFLSLGGRFEF